MDKKRFAELGPNNIILTPNQRLANTLQKEIENYHFSAGHLAYVPPTLLSFSQFIRTLWHSYIFISPKKLLSNDEEKWLWQKIINQSEIATALLNTRQASHLIQAAWHHLAQWKISVNYLSQQTLDNENLYFFTTWANHFTELCSQRDLIDESTALEAYANNSSFIKTLPYKNIYFYHFIEMTPLQKHFITSLEQQNKSVTIIEPSSINRELFRLELETPEEEILSMATWAKEKHAQDKNAIIGCVIPTLHQRRDEVLRNFQLVFNTKTPPVDISAGYLLSEYTLIQHMNLCMELLSPSFDYEKLSCFLRSAHFGGSEEEMFSRSQLDIELRNKSSKTTSLKKIIAIITTNAEAKGGSPLKIYSQINTLLEQSKIAASKPQSIQAWCQQWLQLLTELGWPGQRNLSSTEHQVTQRFISLMQEIEDFCTLQTHWSWHEFSLLLKTKCQQTIFQPEADKTSIQILGLLEASGMTFDYLWVIGLDDKTWPSSPSPNPFLSYELQKKYGMPHASAEREYLFCLNLQEKLINSSGSVIFSSPKYDADRKLNPSPLITNIQKNVGAGLVPALFERPQELFSILEHLTDNIAPAVSENESIAGGTSIVQLQALCPFRAFATIRLKSHHIPLPIDAPDALVRGNKIHQALELFWKKTKTSANLLKLTENALDESIKQAITITYEKNTKHEEQNAFFISLEKIRLTKLMHAWLAIEKKRPAFTVIAVEQKKEYRYKNITIRMRVDRIDQLEDDSHVIIDYKTGSPNVQHWLGNRIKEPQLPIYCITHSATVAAVFFAQLRWNDLCIKGIIDGESEISSVIAFEKLSKEMRALTWSEQKIQWKNNINYLLDDFINGKADVDPLEITTCTHCQLHGLCRIFEND